MEDKKQSQVIKTQLDPALCTHRNWMECSTHHLKKYTVVSVSTLITCLHVSFFFSDRNLYRKLNKIHQLDIRTCTAQNCSKSLIAKFQ